MSNDQKRQQKRETTTLPLTVVPLDNGYRLAEGVQPDGTTAYWLLSPEGDDAPQGCACRNCAGHEHHNPFRTICGAATKSTGKPCQAKVRVGERCPIHRVTDTRSN